MHKLLKIGIVLALIGLVTSFIISPLVASNFAADVGKQILRNAHVITLSPASNITLTFNGEKNSSLFVFIYNTSTHAPLIVKGVNVSPTLVGNYTYAYYVNPSAGKIEIINNQSVVVDVYYSFAYIPESSILTIEAIGFVSIAVLFIGIGASIVGLILGRKKS